MPLRIETLVLVMLAAGAVLAEGGGGYDSDRDGVDDSFDVCCGTPENTPVDEQGRPIGDLDNDCDVDLIDFGLLQGAYTGILPSCQACDSSEDCPGDQYCAKLLSECENAGVCAPRPIECSDVWVPVCGCDDATYTNGCQAARGGASLAHEGECPPLFCMETWECEPSEYCEKALGDCDGTGGCVSRPNRCFPDVVSVCGCDGVSYPVACAAHLQGVSVDHEGDCPPPSCQTNDDCAEADRCAKDVGVCDDGAGVCAPPLGGCIPNWERVCGCDGLTYADWCDAVEAKVNLASQDACPP